MKRRTFIRNAGLGSAGLIGAAAIGSLGCLHRSESSRKPNILFIGVDDLNDWVGCMGGKTGIQTPNIDRLAGKGTLFTRAYCSAPSCMPSRTSLMTGLNPSSYGIYDNVGAFWRHNPHLAGIPTLPQAFRSEGYRTAGGGKLFHGLSWISDSYGTNQNDPVSWDTYFPSLDKPMPDHVFPEGTRKEGRAFIWDRVARGPEGDTGPFYPFDWGPLDVADEDMSDHKVADWACSELTRVHDRPFFIAAGIFMPHMPWFVPRKYFDMYPLEDILVPPAPEDDLDDLPPSGRQMGSARRGWHHWLVRNGLWKQAVQSYMASVTFCDAQIGRMIEALESGPNAGNTIVVLWSDHGFHLGEKQTWEKFTLWEESGRVPLIIFAPGVTTPGSRCDVPVSLLDIYPTLLDLCRFPMSAHLEGESLLPLLQNPSSNRDRIVLTTFGHRNHSLRSRRWRYIRYQNGDEELYDHDHDPGEFHNLADMSLYAAVKDKMSASFPGVNIDPWQM